MHRKHFEPRSARKSVKPELPLPPRKAGARVGPWLRLANLFPLLDDLPEVKAIWTHFDNLMGAATLSKAVPVRDPPRVPGHMPGQRLELPAEFKSSLPSATEFMKKARAAGLTNLVSLLPGTEKEALRELARQVSFVLAGLARRPKRTSVTWVTVAYEINPQRSGPAVRAWNPFTRFTEILEAIEKSRLHLCPVCNQFFYAIRKDAPCCSRKCSHTRRQHISTGNWERYKRARAFRARAKLPAVKGKERRRLMELSEALREPGAKEEAEPQDAREQSNARDPAAHAGEAD